MAEKTLARKLRVLRAERDLTLNEASALAGVTRETLGALEHGRRGAHYSTLRKIAQGYGIPIELLVSEEPALTIPEAGAPGTGQQPKEEEPEIGYSHEVEADLFERADVRGWLQGVGADHLLMSDDELIAEWEERVKDKLSFEDAADVLAEEQEEVFAEEAKVERELRRLLNKRGTILGDDDWNRLPEYTRMRRMLRARYEYVYRGIETFSVNLFARGEADDVITYSKRRMDLLRPKLEELRKKRDAEMAAIRQEAVEV